MKKTMLIFALFLVLLNFGTCHGGTYNFNFEDLKDNVIGVELINYNNSNVKKIKNLDNLLSFDFSLMEIIEVLPAEKINAFLEEYSTAYFFEIFNYLDSPNGISLRLFYKNGDFKVVCLETYYVCKFGSDGNVKEFFTIMYQRVLIRIINKYFDTQL